MSRSEEVRTLAAIRDRMAAGAAARRAFAAYGASLVGVQLRQRGVLQWSEGKEDRDLERFLAGAPFDFVVGRDHGCVQLQQFHEEPLLDGGGVDVEDDLSELWGIGGYLVFHPVCPTHGARLVKIAIQNDQCGGLVVDFQDIKDLMDRRRDDEWVAAH